MEAGQIPSAPAVAEPAQTQPVAPEVAPEQVAPEQPPIAPTPGFPPEQGQSDVSTQLQEMQKRAEDAEARLSEAQGPQPTDLVSALLEGGEQEGLTPEQVAAAQDGGQYQENPDSGQELAELDSYVKERIQEAVNPLIEERQDEQVRAFQEKHPDIMTNEKLRSEVLATMANLAGRYGEQAKFDTGLLETTYIAAKAKLADAGAVPAGKAANHGASIETQAGQTQAGESTEEEQYANAILGGGDGDIFSS